MPSGTEDEAVRYIHYGGRYGIQYGGRYELARCSVWTNWLFLCILDYSYLTCTHYGVLRAGRPT